MGVGICGVRVSELTIPRDIIADMLRHVQQVCPEEGCGLLAGIQGIVRKVYCVENSLHSPTRFEMDPIGQVEALMDMEKNGLELAAIFHSHPDGPDHPSESDTRLFFYPEAASLICWRENDQWQIRAFQLAEQTWVPVKLNIS